MRAKHNEECPPYPWDLDALFPLVRVRPSWPKGTKGGGYAKVQFVIGKDGRPEKIKVLESSGSPFEQETIRTVKKWRYCPAFKDGKPIDSDTTVKLVFGRH